MKSDFIPKRSGDLNAFEDNFLNKLNTHAADLGLDSTEIDSVKSIIEAHRTSFSQMNSKKAESKSASEENLMKKEAAVAEIRRMSAKIKACKGYNPAIGDNLGIIGSDTPHISVTDKKPVLKTRLQGNEVVLTFRKDGTDGVKIWSKKGSETEFTFLAIDTSSPYTDNRPKTDTSKPENREYYAVFFEEDSDIGQRSDIVKVTIS
ncbi:MAG: hypothetical protein WAT71_04170 [Ignavibacteria bacterium]